MAVALSFWCWDGVGAKQISPPCAHSSYGQGHKSGASEIRGQAWENQMRMMVMIKEEEEEEKKQILPRPAN